MFVTTTGKKRDRDFERGQENMGDLRGKKGKGKRMQLYNNLKNE